MGLIRPMATHTFAASALRHYLMPKNTPTLKLFSTIRTIHTSLTLSYQHLLYLGNVLGYQSPQRLSKFPRAWLDSVGVSSDVDHGLRWTGASGGPGHALISYTLLDKPLDPQRSRKASSEELVTTTSSTTSRSFVEDQTTSAHVQQQEGTVLDHSSGTSRKNSNSQPSKVFSLGRNTYAQLGLGFSSQEATRGMVTGQIQGRGGVANIVAGSGFSFVVADLGIRDYSSKDSIEGATSGSAIYAFGNDTLGQLGASPSSLLDTLRSFHPISGNDPYDLSTRLPGSDSPQLRLLPLPKRISLEAENNNDADPSSSSSSSSSAGGGEWKVLDLAAGVDHSLMLTERVVNGYRLQKVWSTGLNTDGQLGLTSPAESQSVPMLPLLSRQFQPVPGLRLKPISIKSKANKEDGGEIQNVACGADTSYAITKQGDVWVWGNSEYGQSLAGVQDRIPSPTFVPNPLPEAYTERNLSHLLDEKGEEEEENAVVPRIKKLVAGGSFAGILDDRGLVWVIGYGPRASYASSSSSSSSSCFFSEEEKEWAKLSLVHGFPEGCVVEDLFCGLEYLVAVTRSNKKHTNSKGEDEIGVYIWGIPPRSISTVPIHHPKQVPFTIPRTPRQQYLDENPTLKNKPTKHHTAQEKGSSELLQQVKGGKDDQVEKIKVEQVACTRDYVLLVLNDGKGQEEVCWGECVGPPKEKGTDIV
ncbi:uncharacterized protein MEPE_04060 [Melanopsichium pennsylvanicum]|uniref:Uncharacterized protein n=1 Tax=Melanopsichium pennsylvanicum TaxID=63383 RepID=A0AAJ5C625_9BASI|nr:uncharacterized protein MEPE_04060 [Melanopsichium pennsylvanicum]